ncbi:UNVERIFIED_CONTAM: hypothetical protein Sradi_1561500 [Sesamum radiatum]|uniref:Reverse transcriptase domain-containing protein n=1 Tax=Sesamum radiatum TaxID=300843 RepID=A0AAW2UAJ4_SESRA
MCTDLNKACPKNPYPLPRIDLLVDSTTTCELFTMMDAYHRYHQINMADEDRGATYQRLVNKMFKELIGISMKVYVDDILVKSRKSENHLLHLRQAFKVMRTYGMKLNPTKCTFGVRGGKFMGYMVSEKGN